MVDLTPEEIRLLISQHGATKHLGKVVRRALEVLEDNPLVETEFFPGDLLTSLLKLPADFWASHQEEWKDVHHILSKMDDAIDQVNAARPGFAGIK